MKKCKRLILSFVATALFFGIEASAADTTDGCRMLQGVTAEESLPEKLKIGKISIRRDVIFDLNDPKESGSLYRIANDLHTMTRESTIRQLLPFQTGDTYKKEIIEETERSLIDKEYLLGAVIVPARICGDVIDLIVRTRDAWTLMPSVSYEKTGDDDSWSVFVSEYNLLGTGSRLTIGNTRKDDNDTQSLAFEHEYFLGKDIDIGFGLSDGKTAEYSWAKVEKPFRASITPWAAGLSVSTSEAIGKEYDLGEPILDYLQEVERFELYYGNLISYNNNKVHRIRFGISGQDYDFEDFNGGSEPADRKLVYPWVKYTSHMNKYKRYVNVHRFNVGEHVRIGRSWWAQLGYSSESWDASHDQILIKLGLNDTLLATEKQLLRYHLSTNGGWDTDDDEPENMVNTGSFEYYYLHGTQRRTYVRGIVQYGRELTTDRTMYAGGIYDLRGYPNYYQAGSRRAIITIEQRFYTNYHIWNLLRVAGAIFLDIGQAKFEKDVYDLDQFESFEQLERTPGKVINGQQFFLARDDNDGREVISNIGFGLRVLSDRVSGGNIAHLDFSFPLRDGTFVDDTQVNFVIKRRF